MNPGCSENAGEEHDKASGKLFCAIANRHLALSAKRTEIQKRTKVRLWYISVLYILRLETKACMSQEKAMSSSEEINPLALSIFDFAWLKVLVS